MKIRPILAGLGLLAAAAAPGVLAQDVAYVERTERVSFNIGCDQSGGAPTCDTTQYWLGTDRGTNNVGSTLDATPMGYAIHALDGEYGVTTFAANSTLRDRYVLQGGSDITGQIKLSGFASGAEVGVDSGVYVEISGVRLDTNRFVSLGSAEVKKVVSTPVDTTYAFTVTVPQNLQGVPVGRLSADLGQKHITVLQNGFVNGKGESYFTLPYLEPVS